MAGFGVKSSVAYGTFLVLNLDLLLALFEPLHNPLASRHQWSKSTPTFRNHRRPLLLKIHEKELQFCEGLHRTSGPIEGRICRTHQQARNNAGPACCRPKIGFRFETQPDQEVASQARDRGSSSTQTSSAGTARSGTS